MVNSFENRLIAIRRTIHRYPELGLEEHRTTRFIEQTLNRAGIRTRRVTKTGLIATVKGSAGASRAAFALRADIDALPIQERTGKPYASRRPGIMHACGHDANTTIVLGAALLLNQRRSRFAGTVKFIFQPNEETSGGARMMIDAGVLEGPAVDAIVGVHVSPWLSPGTLGLKKGEMMAAVDRFRVEIRGNGGHGAYPHLGTDAILAASHVVTSLQAIVSRETDPVDPVVVTVGVFQGGERFNILCGKVLLEGTVRTLNERVRRRVRGLVEKKIKYAAAAFGADYLLTYEELGRSLVNSPDILDLCRRSGETVLGPDRVVMLEKPSMGGEDFAEYLQKVPGCFIYYGTAGKNKYPWHHEKFDIDEKALGKGAALVADIAQRYLEGK